MCVSPMFLLCASPAKPSAYALADSCHQRELEHPFHSQLLQLQSCIPLAAAPRDCVRRCTHDAPCPRCKLGDDIKVRVFDGACLAEVVPSCKCPENLQRAVFFCVPLPPRLQCWQLLVPLCDSHILITFRMCVAALITAFQTCFV